MRMIAPLVAGPGSVVVMIISLILIIFIIVKLKVNPVYAMLLGAIGAGIAFGIPLVDVVPVVMHGFGTTIGNIGIVILLGTTIGIILAQTGGALVIANTILRAVGRRNAPLAMGLSGYLISIPVFSDTAIVIMSPVAQTVSARSGKSLIACLGALNAGIMATHTITPPTPGPLAAAGTLGVDLGLMFALGAIVALAYTLAGLAWVTSKPCVSRFPEPAKVEGIEELIDEKDYTIKSSKPLPNAPLTFACLLLPIALICINSFGTLALEPGNPMIPFLNFIGHPVMALGIGVVMCFFLDLSSLSKEVIGGWFEKSVGTSAFIILATGTAGSYGFILRASGVGEFMGNAIAGTALPVVFIPFFVTLLLVLSNGSATVSLITGSAIMYPLLPFLGLHPVVVALALTAGASFAYHVNASHYWVVVRSANLTMREGFFNVTGGTAIGSLAAMVVVFIMSLIIQAPAF